MQGTARLANCNIKVPQYVTTLQTDGFSSSTVFDNIVMLYVCGTKTEYVAYIIHETSTGL
jgi:hypothetical protein